MDAAMRAGVIALTLLLSAAPAQAEKLSLDIARADARFDTQSAKPIIVVMLVSKSARAFADFTQANVGRVIRVTLGRRVLAAPVLRQPITGAWFQIDGGFEIEEATALAREMSVAGAIDVEAALRP